MTKRWKLNNREHYLEQNRAYAARYYAANRERLLIERRQYKAANREKIKAQRRKYEAARRHRLAEASATAQRNEL